MRSEHYDFSNPLFLPISAEVFERLLASGESEVLEQLSDAELAAVLVIQNLESCNSDQSRAFASEQILAKLIHWGNESQYKPSEVSLLAEALRLFDVGKLRSGSRLLHGENIELLPDDTVKSQEYLLPSGEWDTGFRKAYFLRNYAFNSRVVTQRNQELWLSSAQDKVLRTFYANRDEHLHIQGYAGIGKSHLIGSMLQFLEVRKTLVLAKTTSKLNELKQRSKLSFFNGLTFEVFSRKLLGEARFNKGLIDNRASAAHVSNTLIAERLLIGPLRGFSPADVVSLCMRVLDAYCESADYRISEKHIPFFMVPLSAVEANVLIEYSNRIWYCVDPSNPSDFVLPLRGMFLVKKASLLGVSVPARYTHILIDESHDLPASLMRILKKSSQVLITLGDEYQRLSGPALKRSLDVRQSDVTFSVRSGENLERILNPLIQAHPNKIKLAFEASSGVKINVFEYCDPIFPKAPSTILVSSVWEKFQWLKYLVDSQQDFILLGDADGLIELAKACVRLYRNESAQFNHSNERPHEMLYQYSTWDELAAVHSNDNAFLWLQSQLADGYKVSDVPTSGQSQNASQGKAHRLGRVEDVGNMEFESVMLAPELLSYSRCKDAYELDQRICAVYTAASRARHDLYIPGDIEEWLRFHRNNFLYS
jgi:hypothetical protein